MYLEISTPITLHFRHYPVERLMKDGEVLDEHVTSCAIHEGKCRDRHCERADLGHGIAQCCFLDEFKKRVGRRISLTRAIQHLPREQRSQIWAKYFELAPKSKR